MKLFAGSSIGFFNYFFGAHRRRSVIMVALLVLSGLGEGIGVLSLLPVLTLVTEDPSGAEPSGLMEFVTSTLATVGLTPTLEILLGIIVLAITLKSIFLWLAMRQVGFTVAEVTKELRLDLVRAILAARWRYFGRTPVGQFANAISSEAIRSASAYREACVVIGSVLQILVYFAVALAIAWRISLFAAFAGAALVWALRRFVGMSRSAGEDQTRLTKSLTGRLVDALQGIKPVKAMAREELFWPIFAEEVEGLNEAHRRQVVASESLRLFQEPAVTLALAMGLFGALTWSDLPFASVLVLAFIAYRILQHMSTLQMRFQIMATGESAFWSLQEAIEEARGERESGWGDRMPGPLRTEIRFDDVSFAYDDTPVLSKISFAVPAGAFVTFSGVSGGGKTTMVDLIAGLHRPSSGAVLVDGVSLSEMDVRAWRRAVGYVPQDPLLFNDTILRNVTMGDESITEEQAREALEAAGALAFVEDRAGGLDARVGESGGQLSGGQRQRIAIARALVGKPTLLILDEVTTALDPDTEAEICETLIGLRGRVTIVAISHQRALQEAADINFHVEQGRVQEALGGTPVTAPAP